MRMVKYIHNDKNVWVWVFYSYWFIVLLTKNQSYEGATKLIALRTKSFATVNFTITVSYNDITTAVSYVLAKELA